MGQVRILVDDQRSLTQLLYGRVDVEQRILHLCSYCQQADEDVNNKVDQH